MVFLESFKKNRGCVVAILVCKILNAIDQHCNSKLCFDNLSLPLQINSQRITVSAVYNSPLISFASFIEDGDFWLESFDTGKPFYVVGHTNVDVLKSKNKTASYIDLCSSFSWKLPNAEYATRETETTGSCIDYVPTRFHTETNSLSLINCG